MNDQGDTMADPLVITAVAASGVAIAQPWAIGLWKRYIRRGTITPYVTGFIELGFADFGPTIAIDGTLRALHKDVFVKAIEVRLTKHRDQSKHTFEWLAFRSHRASVAGASDPAGFVEAASGFMVTPNTPHRVCIVFSDVETRQLIQKQLAVALARFWVYRRSEPFQLLGQRFLLDDAQVLQLFQGLTEQYQKDSTHVSAYTAIDRICYWETGKYEVELRVHSARPDQTFTERWTIELDEEQAKQLHLNVVNMLDNPLYTTAGLNTPPFFFAYAPYQELA